MKSKTENKNTHLPHIFPSLSKSLILVLVPHPSPDAANRSHPNPNLADLLCQNPTNKQCLISWGRV